MSLWRTKPPAFGPGSPELRFLQDMIVPTFVLDKNRIVVLWNKALEDLSGVRAAQVIGTSEHWRAFYDHARPCLADLLFANPSGEMSNLYAAQTAAGNAGTARAAENWCTMPAVARRMYLVLNASAIHDEKGALVAVIETVKDHTIEQEAKATLAAEREVQAGQFRTLSDTLATALAKLAEGDLRHKIETPLPGTTDRLREDFNCAVGKIGDVLSATRVTAGAVRSSVTDISNAADRLSQRTEKQAANLEETAAALGQVTDLVKGTAERTTYAKTVAADTKASILRSGDIVKSAVTAMGGVAASSRRIEQIIGVIDEIAFQTNLLALNAGVEAARAGEAGRGFAVVASEVRSLAQRTAEAAKEIKTLIATSSEDVARGVQLVGEAGAALDGVIKHTAEVNDIVSAIATSAAEQATSLQEVNTAIRQLDQVTQQNAAMVEETTAASRLLESETDELKHLVDRFSLPEALTGQQPEAPRRRAA